MQINQNLENLKMLRFFLRRAFSLLEYVEFSWEKNSLLTESVEIQESISDILDLLETILKQIEADISSVENDE